MHVSSYTLALYLVYALRTGLESFVGSVFAGGAGASGVFTYSAPSM